MQDVQMCSVQLIQTICERGGGAAPAPTNLSHSCFQETRVWQGQIFMAAPIPLANWAHFPVPDIIRSDISRLLSRKEAYAARLACRGWSRTIIYPELELRSSLTLEALPQISKMRFETSKLNLMAILTWSTELVSAVLGGLFSPSGTVVLKELILGRLNDAIAALLAREFAVGSPSLTSLCFIHRGELVDASALLRSLHSCSSLESLEICSGNFFGPTGSNALADLLRSLPKLRSLTVADDTPSEAARFVDVAKAIVSRGTIKTLCLLCQKLVQPGSEDALKLRLRAENVAQVLKHSSSLTSLQLYEDYTSADSSTSVVNCYRSLTKLKIFKCPSEFETLPYALTSAHAALTTLHLSHVARDALPHVAQSVLLRLRTIQVVSSALSIAAVDLLAHCIQASTCLTSLSLRELRPRSAAEVGHRLLLSLARATSSLQSLQLDSYPLSGQCVASFASFLGRSDCGLHTLEINDCGVSREKSSVLADGLRSNTSLKTFRVDASLPAVHVSTRGVDVSFIVSALSLPGLERLSIAVYRDSYLEAASLIRLRTGLRELRITCVEFDDDQLHRVAEALECSSSLEALTMFVPSASLGGRSLLALSGLIQRSQSLRRFHLSVYGGSHVSEGDLVLLLKAASLNQTLTSVTLPVRNAAEGDPGAEIVSLRGSVAPFKVLLLYSSDWRKI